MRSFLLAAVMALLAFTMPSAAGQSLNAVAYPFRDADPFASPRIKQLRTAVEAGDRSAVEKFWDTLKDTGTPIVEPLPQSSRHSLVTFVWRGAADTRNVVVIDGVATAVGGLDPQRSQLTRLLDTDVWYRTYDVRNDARFHYWLIPNSTRTSVLESNPESRARPDPLNPRRLGPVSYLELPAAPGASFTTASASLAHGKVERSKFHSEILHNDRDVWVYTPPSYQPSGPRYPLLVVFDGGAYLDQVPVPVILDNLIAQNRIPPMVAALVGNAVGRRDAELACDKPFAEFLATELVPWMRKNYDATDDASRTVVGGSSRGGLASAFAGFQHPEVFGNVLSQSGSYWWSPPEELEQSWLTRQFAQSPRRPIKISMSAGLMEVPDQLDTNRHLRDVLVAKGYAVHYSEFNGNHSYVAWRADFAERLTALIGSSPG